MTTKATCKKFYEKYTFLVQIDGMVDAGFMRVSGLVGTLEKIEYSEGTDMVPCVDLGKATFDDIVLERGETDNDELYRWWEEALRVASGLGGDTVDVRRTVIVVQRARDGRTLRRWVVAKAIPTKFETDDWDAGTSEHHIERLTLSHRGFEIAA